MQLLFSCEDNNPYWTLTTDHLVETLSSFLLLMGSSYVTAEIDWGQSDVAVEVTKILSNIKKLSDRDRYENVFDQVVLENETTRTIAANYIVNLLGSIKDRVVLRLDDDNYNKDADTPLSKLANLVVLADGANIYRGHLADFLERQYNNLDKLKPDSNRKLIGKSLIFDYGKSNVVGMVPRAMYKTYFQQQLAVPYISASDQQFRDDLAGNLASLMVSGTDILSFGLAYTELVLDTYDYIEIEISAVADIANASLKDYEHAQQEINYKLQTLEQVSQFSNKLQKIYFEDKLTETQFRRQIQKAYDELEDGIQNIYKLDPNVIKLYINGKPVAMPEPAYISKGTTMVPLRVISEELGVKPIWNAKARTITFSTNKSPMSPFKPIDITLTVGNTRVQVGSFTEYVTVAPTIKNGTTFVPLAFIANHLGLDSVWEAGSKSVILKSRK